MTELELLEEYKISVDNIPDVRYAITYTEEVKYNTLKYLIDNHNRQEDDKILLLSCRKYLKGMANPVVVINVINEWKTTYG